MDFEGLLKLAVNYGLGIFFAVGISIAFFCHLRDEKKLSVAREERLMNFIETHMSTMQLTITDHIKDVKTSAQYQRTEHESMIKVLNAMKDSIYKMTVKLNVSDNVTA